MKTRDLIESGIVESYLLGMVTKEEQRIVREKALTDNEFNEYLVSAEQTVQSYFNDISVLPPSSVRDIILLRGTRLDAKKPKHVFENAGQKKATTQFLDIEVSDTHIKVHKYWRPAFIAVFILSKIFLIAGLYFYFKSQSVEQELVKLKTELYLRK